MSYKIQQRITVIGLLSRVDSPRAGFYYDSGHHNCWAADDDLLSRYGSRLMILHLHDNNGVDDQSINHANQLAS